MRQARSPMAAAGQFIDVSTAAMRPQAAIELTAYGIAAALRGAEIIDIGTGDGRLAFGAAAAGAASVIGLDPDPAAVRAARNQARDRGRGRTTFRVGSAQELDFPRERFDIAILSWTL